MHSFTKSLGRFSWALSLFGLGGLADLLGGRRGSWRSDTAAAAFDSATGALEQRIPNPFRTIFRIGDRLLDSFLDVLFAGSEREGRPATGCGCDPGPVGPADAVHFDLGGAGFSGFGMPGFPPAAPGTGAPGPAERPATPRSGHATQGRPDDLDPWAELRNAWNADSDGGQGR